MLDIWCGLEQRMINNPTGTAWFIGSLESINQSINQSIQANQRQSGLEYVKTDRNV